MDFEDNEFSNQVLINLLKRYTNLKFNVDITRLFTLLEVFNQLELNDSERIDYLSYSEYLWDAYLTNQKVVYPDKNVITKEDVDKFGSEHGIWPI